MSMSCRVAPDGSMARQRDGRDARRRQRVDQRPEAPAVRGEQRAGGGQGDTRADRERQGVERLRLEVRGGDARVVEDVDEEPEHARIDAGHVAGKDDRELGGRREAGKGIEPGREAGERTAAGDRVAGELDAGDRTARGSSGPTTTMTRSATIVATSTAWARSGRPSSSAASLSPPNRVDPPPASTIAAMLTGRPRSG